MTGNSAERTKSSEDLAMEILMPSFSRSPVSMSDIAIAVQRVARAGGVQLLGEEEVTDGVVPEGVPCWVDVALPDLVGGAAFYAELLGWDFSSVSQEYGYLEALSGGMSAGGLGLLPAGMDPMWTVYFATQDIFATAKRIRQDGGKITMEPVDLGEFGRLMMAEDSQGARFGVLELGARKGVMRTGLPGTFCWVELATRDAAAADQFYSSVFPYKTRQITDPNYLDYAVWDASGQTAAGRFEMGAEVAGGTSPRFIIYLGVKDCDRALEIVQRFGGEVKIQSGDTQFGRSAIVSDPQGAEFGIIEVAGG